MANLGEKGIWVRWFMDFLKADLKKLSRMQEGRLAGDIVLILVSQLSSEDSPPEGLIFEEGEHEDTKFLSAWRNYFKTGPKALDLGKIQDHLRISFQELMSNVQRVRAGSDNLSLAFMSISILVSLRVAEPAQEGSSVNDLPLSLLFRAHSIENTLLLFLIRNLEDVRLGSFGSCVECKAWFVNLTKREKHFCCNACAARYGVRKSRAIKKEEDVSGYKEELKAKAERSHKAYVEKVKSRHPNAKVTRRPLKHKDEED